MKRVLQISNYYYPHIGGIEHVARDVAKVLSREKGFEQKIICFNEDACNGEISCIGKDTVSETVDGIEVTRCGSFTKMASQSISLSFMGELKRIMDDFQPDIVIFHYPNPYQTVFLERYLDRKFKLFLYWHLDITKQRFLGKIFQRQTIRLLERADKIVATSQNYIDGSPYLSRYREKCVVIPICIDETRLQKTEKTELLADEIRKQNDGKIICFSIGRHVEYKGFTYLIRASKQLDDRFHFYIGGQGPLTERLKAEAADDDKITFLGRISDEELIAWYTGMDIFCFPSITKNEAFGISLAEAMYFGKPAVTFTIPGSGVNYVCKDGITGIECPNGDSKSYASVITRLAADPDLREQMGISAHRRVKELFSDKQFQEEFISLIK